MAPVAVFRADAGPTIGGGHVMRCLVLADALADRGWRCVFAVSPATRETVARLRDSRHQVLVLDGGDDPEGLAAGLDGPADWLVVDHYGRDRDYQSACRLWARRILVIDDLADRPHDCDLLLDPTLGRAGADYGGLVPGQARVLTGAKHALLRPEFATARPRALARRTGRIARVVIAPGLTDPDGISPPLAEAILDRLPTARVDVVLSATAPAVAILAGRGHPRLRLHCDVDDMAALYTAADLAIGAAGTSSWERCCLGLPTLLMVLADNQRLVAERLVAAGAALPLGSAPSDGQHLDAALDRCRPEALVAMAHRAAAVTDGWGADRVLRAMAEIAP